MKQNQCICGGVVIDKGKATEVGGRRRKMLVRAAECLRCKQIYPLNPAGLGEAEKRMVERHNQEALGAHNHRINGHAA